MNEVLGRPWKAEGEGRRRERMVRLRAELQVILMTVLQEQGQRSEPGTQAEVWTLCCQRFGVPAECVRGDGALA